MKIFVIGSTGVLGRNVVPRLIERGHKVTTAVRKPEQAERLRRLGVDASIGDILDLESLIEPTAGCDAVLHLATVIPKRGEAWDLTRDAEVRRVGTRNMLDASLHGGVRRYVQQSITFIYGNQGTKIADESTPVAREFNQSVVDMEGMVRESSLDWCILRGGLFYGPNAGLQQGLTDDARAEKLRAPGDGSALLSVVHEADMAYAFVLAVENAAACSLYNVVDDKPVTYKDLYAHVTALAGLPEPATGGDPHLPALGCSNARIKANLGWRPAYSTYLSGMI